MHTIQLLAGAIPVAWQEPLPCDPQPGVCCLTGAAGLTIPRQKLLTSSFTDWWAVTAPESDRVSVEAWQVFMSGTWGVDPETGEAKKMKKKMERMACWWTDGWEWRVEIERDKAQLRRLVFQPPAERWAGYITRTYKKHGSLRSPVNPTPFGRWGFDDQIVDASHPERMMTWWQRLRTAQERGIPRPLIESADATAGVKLSLFPVWVEYQAWAQTVRNDPLFAFLCYLLPSKDERAAGYQDEWTLAEAAPDEVLAPPRQGILC